MNLAYPYASLLVGISSILVSMVITTQYPAAFAGACVDNDGDLFYANDECRPNLDPDDNNPCIPDENSEACIASEDPIGAIDDVRNNVNNLISSGDFDINSAQVKALLTKLKSAIKYIESDKINVAINNLNAFNNQINAYINSGAISHEDGQVLISDVQSIINML